MFQLSLDASLSPVKHLAMGEALAPLREQGVLIVGSGFTTHRGGGPAPAGYSKKLQVRPKTPGGRHLSGKTVCGFVLSTLEAFLQWVGNSSAQALD